MSRLTDEQLSDIIARVEHGKCFKCDGTGNEQPWRMCSACEGTGVFALATSVMDSMLVELCDRRASDLSDEDRQGLEFAKARVLFNMNASAASEYFSDGYVDRHLHAVAVLDRLLSHAGGDK